MEVHLEDLAELFVKAANKSGGYGILDGPRSTMRQCADFTKRIQTNPRNYIAELTLSLSHVPTIVGDDMREEFFVRRPVAGLTGVRG